MLYESVITGVDMWAKVRGSVASAIFATLLVASMPALAAAGTPSWDVQTLPWTIPGPVVTNLASVSCAGGTCVGVGSLSGRSGSALVEIRNAGGWTPVPNPSPPDVGARWSAVSCSTATFCAAVGQLSSIGLDPVVGEVVLGATVWNGATWTTSMLGTFVGLSGPQLNSISCVGSSCVAVGNDGGAPSEPMAEILSGGVWKQIALPFKAGTQASMSSVSCADPTDCTAVGEESNGDALIDALSGGQWTSALVAPPSGSSLGPNGISCWGPSQCEAVGTWNVATEAGASEAVAMLLQISGGSATVSRLTTPPSTGSQLSAVMCFSVTSCIAVGGEGRVAIEGTLSGTTWSEATIPSAPSAGLPYASLGCSSVTSCEAVGGSHAVSLSGSTWSIDDPPAISGPPLSALAGLACPYAGHCIGVGTFASPTHGARPFVETMNAGTWSLGIPSLPGGALTAELSGISCPGPHDCDAVGSWTDSSGDTHPYVDLMTRGTWTAITLLTPLTAPPYPFTELSRISCSSDTECVAVGTASNEKWGLVPDCAWPEGHCAEQSFAARLTGTNWTTAYLPGPFGLSNSASLTSVSCWAKSHCVAVGLWWQYGQQNPQGLIETLNGKWHPSSAPTPKRATVVNLNGVACSSSIACQIVGEFETNAESSDQIPIQFPLFETGGSTGPWTLDRPSGAPAPIGSLDDVTCSSVTTCAAVGTNGTDALTTTLSDGKWSATTSAPPAGYSSVELNAIACLPYSGCESVGQAFGNGATVPVLATP